MKIIEGEYYKGELESFSPLEISKNTEISDLVKSFLKENYKCNCDDINHKMYCSGNLAYNSVSNISLIKCDKCKYYIHIYYGDL